MAPRKAPSLASLLTIAAAEDKPIALVLAGHNGSGKSTLWYDRLADALEIPLVNADRLTLSLLPPVDENGKILMESQFRIGLSPNGNGAMFEAFNKILTINY